MLKSCLYQREVCIREMSIREVPVFREVFVLKSSLYKGDVCIREMSVLERCLY